jgi:hypothetical protein
MVGSIAKVTPRNAVLAVVLLFALPISLWCQSTSTGTVAGQVTDQTNALVVGATVTLSDISTNTERTATTNDAGRYVFPNIAPGVYDIKVNKPGFSQARVQGQKVEIGSALTINVALKVGSTEQTVNVEASGTTLQTLNATVGTTISFQNLQELPNLSRDVSSLLTLQPAISSNGSVAGAVRDQNTFQLDGGNNSDDMAGTMNTYTASYAATAGVTGVMPTPVESIEEFKVNVTNQTADFNGSSGAQVQMATRRGGNTWHGAVYNYYLGSNFSANTWLNNHTPTKDGTGKIISPTTKLPSNHYNRFGVSGGGPVGPSFWGGKTFIFANYEGRRYPQNTIVDKTVPTPLLRLGVIQIQDSAGTFRPYNLNPFPVTYNGVTYAPASCPGSPNGLCDPRGIGLNSLVSQVWNKQMPLPNDATAGDTFNTQGYLTSLKLPQNDNFGVVRLDHDFSQNWKFMASYRYYHLERAVNNQYDIGGVLGGTFGVAKSTANRPQVPSYYVLGLTTNVTHNLTNDFHYNYLRNFWQWTTASAQPQLAGLGGALEMGGEVCSNTGSSSSSLTPYCTRTQDARQRYWNGHDHVLRDDLTLIHGNHLLQFGGQFQHNWDAHQRNDNGLGIMAANVYQIGASSTPGLSMPAAFIPAGVASSQLNTYKNLYSQVLGIVTQPQTLFTRSTPDLSLATFGTPVVAHSITKSYNLYFSDSWRIKPSFTLTYGLGYQLEMPPFEVDGKQVLLVDQAGNPIRTEDYLASRKKAALAGQVYNPVLAFATVGNVGGGRKYPYDVFYGGFSPRLAAAWNPHFDGSLMKALLGNGNTVIRGGWGRTYGRMNGVINILTPLLAPSLLQAVQCQGAVNAANTQNGSQCLGAGGATPATAFRIGTDGLTAPLPTAVQKLPQPFLPGVAGSAASGDALALDPSYRPSSVDSFDLTIQREINSKMSIEVGYIGRLIRHELTDLDLNAVPYMTTLNGQSFDKAYAALYTGICGLAGGACAGNAYTGAAQPFFEAAMGGPTSAYCTGFANCTAAVASKQASNIKVGGVYDMWFNLATQTSWSLGRTLPASNPPGGCVVSASSVCQQLTSIAMSLSNGYGNYNAAFASFNLRDWHGMTGRSNFTWGRALGTGATTQSTSGYTVVDPWDLRMMYGPQFFDTKFLFNSSLSYHLPFYKQQAGFLGRVLGGWGVAPLLTAQSGLPIQVSSGSNCQSWGESSCSNTTNENAVLLGNFSGLSSHYNVTATGSAGKSGNAPSGVGLNSFADPQASYNSFRRLVLGVDNNGGGGGRVFGFARWNLDASITKETRFTERTGATFYALFTNLFNHFQPTDPTMSIDSPSSWGVVTNAATGYDQRQIEFGLRIHF